MNETLKTLTTRRSVRAYLPDQVKEDDLKLILEAGTYAPTGMGAQSPVMVVVQDPETIRQTTLIPNELRKESEDEKLGILDVLVDFPKDQRCYRKIILCDAETGEPYTDLIELHILELKKLPPEDQNETGFIRRISFLNGRSRKELK